MMLSGQQRHCQDDYQLKYQQFYHIFHRDMESHILKQFLKVGQTDKGRPAAAHLQSYKERSTDSPIGM